MLQTDNGKEFINSNCQRMLASNDRKWGYQSESARAFQPHAKVKNVSLFNIHEYAMLHRRAAESNRFVPRHTSSVDWHGTKRLTQQRKLSYTHDCMLSARYVIAKSAGISSWATTYAWLHHVNEHLREAIYAKIDTWNIHNLLIHNDQSANIRTVRYFT